MLDLLRGCLGLIILYTWVKHGNFFSSQRVKITVHAMLAADNPVAILQKRFSDWYTALFLPAFIVYHDLVFRVDVTPVALISC